MNLVTILGGTGVFGSRIASDLAEASDIAVRIAARDSAIGEPLANGISAEFVRCDIGDRKGLRRVIDGSSVVIHAAGPFQGRDYTVAEACIDAGCHYLDLADGRRHVVGIRELDGKARARNVFVASGASSVPAITHAMLSASIAPFEKISEIHLALSPGNQNPRGASTIGAILTYLGRPIESWSDGRWITRIGWSDAKWLEFPHPVGRRRVHNCDVPDLELFPSLFRAESVQFQAGVELNVINYTLSALAVVRRAIPMRGLHKAAPAFLRGTLLLRRFGTKNGSLAAWVRGIDHEGKRIERRIAIVTDHDGPATPCSPSIVLTRKIIANGPPCAGAFPCVGFLTLEELLLHLSRFGIWVAHGDDRGWFAGNGDSVQSRPCP